MRGCGWGLVESWDWTMSVPALVQSMEGCRPSGRIMRSGPKMSERRGSVTRVSVLFLIVVQKGTGSAAFIEIGKARGAAAAIVSVFCRKVRREIILEVGGGHSPPYELRYVHIWR